MKKMNDKQQKVIEFFQTQLKYWENTSDIDSYTHFTDISEQIYSLSDLTFGEINNYLTADDLRKIEDMARDMYILIKGIK